MIAIVTLGDCDFGTFAVPAITIASDFRRCGRAKHESHGMVSHTLPTREPTILFRGLIPGISITAWESGLTRGITHLMEEEND